MPDDLRTRIADVLRLHQWRATVRTSDDDPVLDCSCGIAFGGALDCQRGAFDSHREHVADAVIAELDLGIPCDRLPNEADSAAARRSHQQIGATNR